MSEVFISYRRESGSTMAMLIKVELERNGFENCFLDVAGLSLGHFDEALLDEIERADVGGWSGARRFADWALVDLDNASKGIPTA